ncbi:MAG: type II toxin-antitoxin system RelE/ParE family toxin [Nonlabens sp.]|uniref:type II toxin-antitoxin system RelE/ParE family toxin n=1 Tax=Nonlabens sp. TaxID=1888209 RepID=UPI003EFA4FCF
MAFKITFSKRAVKELSKAYLYYKEKSIPTAVKFEIEVKVNLKYLNRDPHIFKKSTEPYREIYLGNFPFLLIYSIIENEVIIQSVFHTSRNPDYKP